MQSNLYHFRKLRDVTFSPNAITYMRRSGCDCDHLPFVKLVQIRLWNETDPQHYLSIIINYCTKSPSLTNIRTTFMTKASSLNHQKLSLTLERLNRVLENISTVFSDIVTIVIVQKTISDWYMFSMSKAKLILSLFGQNRWLHVFNPVTFAMTW